MKPTSGSVRFHILGFRINETLDELSELARHRCNAHDLSHVLCCMDITRHIALIQGGLNKPTPPRVPRLAITLSSSESVARSSSSLI